MNFSLKERLLLANQYRILEKLSHEDGEAKQYAAFRKIVEDGFTSEYSDLTSGFEQDELTEEQCHEVIDILDMWRHLKDSFDRLPDKGDLSASDVRFWGFDGNDHLESRYAEYVEFQLEDGKWRELQDRKGNLNSHHETLEKYRLMLEVHKRFSRKADLSAEQIKEILAAESD